MQRLLAGVLLAFALAACKDGLGGPYGVGYDSPQTACSRWTGTDPYYSIDEGWAVCMVGDYLSGQVIAEYERRSDGQWYLTDETGGEEWRYNG